MKSRILMLSAVALVLALPALATAQQLFDFDGQALIPGSVGGTLDMLSVVRDPAPATTPLPLDFANFEYTLVITGLTLVAAGSPQDYAGGTITIYEDNATTADYGNPATFTDGTAILVGTFDALYRTMFTSTLGSAQGTVDWTGGTMVGEFAPADRLDWPFVTGISRRASDVEPGYDEAWDGKVEPFEPVVATPSSSWGEVKTRY